MSESVQRWSDGEDGVSPDLLAVRSVLRSLPTVSCPVGFEYRLEKKLAGEQAGVRSAGSARGWAWGWAGAGLGFATALAIAFFVFDVNVKPAGVSSGGQPVPVAQTPVTTTPSGEIKTIREQAPEEKQLAKTNEDTTKKQPPSKVDLPHDVIHVVGTNQAPNK